VTARHGLSAPIEDIDMTDKPKKPRTTKASATELDEARLDRVAGGAGTDSLSASSQTESAAVRHRMFALIDRTN
jgi:hypothetical protein